MNPHEGSCQHKTGFIKWLCAVEYYGYYECDLCKEKIQITKEERRKYHNKYLWAVPVLMISSILSVELQKPYLYLLSLLLCVAVYLVYLYIKSPAYKKKDK